MSQEDLLREINLTNEKLAQALLEANTDKSKVKDWKTNPVLYIIITLFLTFIINFVERKINYDENHMVESALMKKTLDENSGTIRLLSANFSELEKILIVIRVKISEDDEKEKTWEEFVKEYEAEMVNRGQSLDSIYSSCRIFIIKDEKDLLASLEEDNGYLAGS